MRWIILIFLAISGSANATVLTLTANNYTVHVGDRVPPMTFRASGFAGTDTWTQAVASGYPAYSTTYTPTSPVGTYPITISAGTLTAAGSYTFAFSAGTITVEAATGNGIQNLTIPTQPSGMMPNMTAGNSACSPVVAGLGDAGATATTTNINCFLSTNRSTANTFGNAPKAYYLPCGVYTVNAPILFIGSAVALWGDGPDCTIIKLAQSTAAFSNINSPIDWVYFEGAGASGAQNNGYNEYLNNVGIEVGPGNPGTNALAFTGSNYNGIRNVWVYFDDSIGACDFCENHALPGQTFIKDYAGYGGNYCFRGTQEAEYNTVFTDITCENQNIYGYFTANYNVELMNYFSVSANPAWNNLDAGETLINAEIIGTAGTGTALTNGAPATMYVRNATVTGYTNSMVDSHTGCPATLTGNITEHFTCTAQTLFSTGPATGIIITPVLETPIANDPTSGGVLQGLAASPDTTQWNTQLASCPASGVFYIPVAHNYPSGTVDTSNDANFTGVYTPAASGAVNMTVPSCINHILFNHATFRSGGANFANITTTGTSATPLIIDGIGGADTKVITQGSARTVVMEDGNISFTCIANSTAFFEDVETQNSINFCSNENVFMRAHDNETIGTPMGIASFTYVSATNTLTMQLGAADPGLSVGLQLYYSGLAVSTWLNGTVALITNISGSTVTLSWLGSHADYGPSTEGAGNYRSMGIHTQCTGCNLWMLGYKTEDSGPLVNINGGQVEIDGGFFYPVRPQFPGTAAFYITDSNAFFTGQIFATVTFSWNNFVQETKSGIIRKLANPGTGSASATTLLNGFYSVGSTPAPGSTSITYGAQFFGGSLH